MAEPAAKSYSSDPTLYLYTSLTSGSSHIVTATSRLETILKANRIPFKALDIATDEKARMLWGRRSGKDETGRVRKLPGLVQMGLVVGDLVEIEEWNEYGELKMHVKIIKDPNAPAPPKPLAQPIAKAPVAVQENKKPEALEPSQEKAAPQTETKPAGAQPTAISLALRQAGEEAAQKAKELKKKGMETFTGVGKAEAAQKQTATKPTKEKEVTKPGPLDLSQKKSEVGVESVSSLQSPNSTAWKPAPLGTVPTSPPRSLDALTSLQSPNSTAWRPTDVNPPILVHRGSSISQASAEEIKKIEEAETIKEEDEEDEDDDDTSESSSEEEESSDEEEPVPVKKATEAKKVSPQNEESSSSEEDDDDDEEDDDDDDDDDDEEEVPGKQTRAPVKEDVETSDSSESSDEEARAPLPPASTKPVKT